LAVIANATRRPAAVKGIGRRRLQRIRESLAAAERPSAPIHDLLARAGVGTPGGGASTSSTAEPAVELVRSNPYGCGRHLGASASRRLPARRAPRHPTALRRSAPTAALRYVLPAAQREGHVATRRARHRPHRGADGIGREVVCRRGGTSVRGRVGASRSPPRRGEARAGARNPGSTSSRCSSPRSASPAPCAPFERAGAPAAGHRRRAALRWVEKSGLELAPRQPTPPPAATQKYPGRHRRARTGKDDDRPRRPQIFAAKGQRWPCAPRPGGAAKRLARRPREAKNHPPPAGVRPAFAASSATGTSRSDLDLLVVDESRWWTWC